MALSAKAFRRDLSVLCAALTAVMVAVALLSGCGSGGSSSSILPQASQNNQVGQVTGSVVDYSTGGAVEGATVSVESGQSTTTDSAGRFTLTDVPVGQHTLTVSGTTADGGTVTTVSMTISISSGQSLDVGTIKVTVTGGGAEGGGEGGETGGGGTGGEEGGGGPPPPPF